MARKPLMHRYIIFETLEVGPDLAESGILVNLDQFVGRYEPDGFQNTLLCKTGNYYKGNFYG